MRAFEALFEDSSELVSISDADSRELLYLNRRLRQALGFTSHGDYRGLDYSRVLGAWPETEAFLSRRRRYPGLDRELLVKTTVCPLEGRRCRLELATEPENVPGALDILTGAYHRSAFFDKVRSSTGLTAVGVIYCDITGLKLINDSLGHDAGDRVIRRCFRLLRDSLDTPWIYRTGSAEFMAVYPDTREDTLRRELELLRAGLREEDCHMAAGYVWTDRTPIDFDALIARADEKMYQEKQRYYASDWLSCTGNSRPDLTARADAIERFAAGTYTDMGAFFHSIAHDNSSSCFYFGDMQKDLFYISDNMRDIFGFPGNIVSGLLQEWEKLISSSKCRDMYRSRLSQLLEQKDDILDMRYQVKTSDGRDQWVRSYGVMTWSRDRSKPLFFSGRLTYQDDNFLVDPVTNFPKGSVALKHLEILQKYVPRCQVLGFSLNNISDVNSTHGRSYGDGMVRHIADALVEEFSGKPGFYRLEGMRFAVLCDPRDGFLIPELMQRIRRVAEDCYHELGICVHRPVSFALMTFDPERPSFENFLDQMSALINMSRSEPNAEYVDNSDFNLSRLRRISDMVMALNRDVQCGMEHFRIVIQPLVSSGTGRIVGGETLMRWTFLGENISPAVFIPYLEKERMIAAAGKWIFAQAVYTCRSMLPLHPDFFLTVNVSLYQLSDPDFVPFIQDTMECSGLDGSHLIVEMTESCMDEEPEKLVHFVEACGKYGIRVALDDFGTGYSSLRVLLQYPSTLIKLDRSLLLEMSTSAEKANFISSLVFACHRFGKKVCMEGVETPAQDDLVKQCGCDIIQGFYYHRPMEVEDVRRLLAQSSDQ